MNLLDLIWRQWRQRPMRTLLSAFSVPGNFTLSIASMSIDVPGAVDFQANGIQVNYNPGSDQTQESFNPVTNPNELVHISQAVVTFPALGGGSLSGYYGALSARVGEQARSADQSATVEQNVSSALSAQRVSALIELDRFIEGVHQPNKKGFPTDLIEERFFHPVTLIGSSRMVLPVSPRHAGLAQW